MKFPLRSVVVFVALLAGLRAAEPAATPSGLDAGLLPTTQYAHSDIFFRTPSGRGPALVTTNEIAPGQRLDLLVVVNGYAVDAESKAHVTYELVIHYPNGTTQRLPNRITVAENTKADPRTLLFPKDITSFSTNPGDPSGDYRFEISLRDHVSGATLAKSVTVRVSDSAAPLPWPADSDVLRFISDYYRNPRPRLALAALTAFSQTSFAERKADGHGALFGFHEQLFTDNPWLLPQFVQRLSATTDASERRLIALVLSYARRSDPAFGKDLPRAGRNALAAARKESSPLPSLEPTQGGQLDLQWGLFLASGRFAPIANLVAVVQNYLPYRGKLEEFKKLPLKPKTLPPEVTKDIVLSAAMWSLGSNAHQQKLVRDYLVGLEQANGTTPEVKAALQEALAWRPKAAPSAPSGPK